MITAKMLKVKMSITKLVAYWCDKFRESLSLTWACLLSMLVHGLLFALLTLLMKTWHSPGLQEYFLVFDFDSVPVIVPENREKVVKPHSIKPEPSVSGKPRDYKIPSSRLLATDLPDESPERDHIPDPGKIFDVDEINSMTAGLPASLPGLRRNINNAKFIATIAAMSQQQQAFLHQQAKKLTEKLDKLARSDSVFVWHDRQQNYYVTLHRKPAKTVTGLDEVVFEITTKQDGRNLSSEMRMKRLAFSNYAQFIDYWDTNVAIHDDEITGRFHCNSSFTISRSGSTTPKFDGKVTTASFDINSSHPLFAFNQQSMFAAGIERGVKEIRLPRQASPLVKHTAGDSSCIHVLPEDTWITFQRDGTYTWKTRSAPNNVHRNIIPAGQSFYIIGENKAVLHVQGILRGDVVVYSTNKIVIDDDLLYVHHPAETLLADDYLALVCDKDIAIAHPKITGTGDLHIFAAIHARRRFGVSNLHGHGKATLHIYGSLSAGVITATEPRYATRVVFDRRLENRRPPGFPVTDCYEMIEWKRRWEVNSEW